MPQMAPMLWLILFIYFVVLFIFYIILIYFMFLPIASTSNSSVTASMSPLTWMW